MYEQKSKSPVRVFPTLLLSLSVFAVLYLSAHRPLVILFHHGHSGIFELMLLLSNMLLGLVLAAVVNSLLEETAFKPYAVFLAALFAVVFCLSGLLVLAVPSFYPSEPRWFTLLLTCFPQFVGVAFTVPGIAAHLIGLCWLNWRRRASAR